MVCFFSVFLGLFGVFVDSRAVKSAVVLLCAPAVTAAIFVLLRRTDPTVARISAFVYLRGALCPSTRVMFYWYHAADTNGCLGPLDNTTAAPALLALEGGAELLQGEFGRPCLSAEFLGVMAVVQQVFSLVGASSYNHWFSRWPTRRVVALGQCLLIAANLLDLVWVMRWNLEVGISDKLMLLGEDTLTPMINGIAFLPMNILVTASSSIHGIEATLCALQWSLWNFGDQTGRYLGVVLLAALGGVEPPEFENLPLLVLIRSLCRALPLALIPMLLPEGTPQDRRPAESPRNGRVNNAP